MHLVIKDKTMWCKFRKHEKRQELSQLSISRALADADIMWQSAYEISIDNGINWVSLRKDISKDRKLKEQLNLAQIMARARNHLKR